MRRDRIVDETRKARKSYAAKFGHDLEAIFRDLRAKEEQHRERVVQLRPRQPISVTSAQGKRRH